MQDQKPKVPTQQLELTPVSRSGDPIVQYDPGTDRENRFSSRRFARRHKMFLMLVALPTFLSALYFGLVASDQFTSEARFIVRSVSGGGPLSTLSNLGIGTNQTAAQAVASSVNFSRALDETYSVNEFIRSRDAVEKLEGKNELREIFSRPEGDFVNRFPNILTKNNKEKFYRHYLDFVNIYVQGDSGISVLEVTTFRPEDSQNLALALLSHAEALVNKLNTRARADSVRFSEEFVRKAEERIEQLQTRMTDFRNRELVVDPGKQSESALDLVTKLTGEAAAERVQLENVLILTPNSPQIEPLRNRLRSIETQIARQRSLIVGSDQSMVEKLSRFEQITLERELAVKSLTAALVSLENARQEAQRQQLYLERVVEPNLPDYPNYPRALMWMSIIFGVSLCVFWIVREFRVAVLEHQL